LAWFISLTLSQTLRQLSQHGVRLHVNWVNAKDTNIYEDFIILLWLSWRGDSLRIDSVDVESYLALTQLTRNETPHQLSHCWMLKISNTVSWRIQEQNWKNSEALLFSLYVFDKCKKPEQKISCRCTFKWNNGMYVERIIIEVMGGSFSEAESTWTSVFADCTRHRWYGSCQISTFRLFYVLQLTAKCVTYVLNFKVIYDLDREKTSPAQCQQWEPPQTPPPIRNRFSKWKLQ
jgi:hypothetical protein